MRLCLLIYVLRARLVLTEVRRGCQLPWSWITTTVSHHVGVINRTSSSVEAGSALNC